MQIEDDRLSKYTGESRLGDNDPGEINQRTSTHLFSPISEGTRNVVRLDISIRFTI